MISIVFDTETTGLTLPSVSDLSDQPKAIEFGAVLIENGEIIKEYNQLINPGKNIDVLITKITGITNNDLVGKPNFSQVAEEIKEMFDSSQQFIAHNIEFDKNILEFEFKRLNIPFRMNGELICTVQEFHHIFGYNPKLKQIYKHFIGEELHQTHRALDDVKALVAVLNKIRFWG